MTGPEEELAPEPTGGVGAVAFAWLPAGDYEQATRLWPDFAGGDRVAGPDGPLPHPQYCRTMQHILVEYAEAGIPMMVIAPVQVAPFTAWCAERGREPDSAEARSEYAAHLAATADPCLIAWPPGRNEPCWCGSGRKYKKCCAAPTSVDADPHR
ncbi:MAG TPA: SEC-C metal-binding domain-containing protein [Mycobacterium sp.]|nr:SEC-C metal-binding domain-containing protein [Mycobacterium sp.]